MIISEDLVKFKAARSSGPGGQRLNKRATKVHMWVKVADLPISDDEKRMVRERLDRHINHQDELWVECQEERFQELNREKALEHLNAMVEEAIATPLERIPTEPRVAAEEARIAEKKAHSQKKKKRRYVCEINDAEIIK